MYTLQFWGCSRLINLAGMIEGGPACLEIAAGKRCCAPRVIYVDMLMRPGGVCAKAKCPFSYAYWRKINNKTHMHKRYAAFLCFLAYVCVHKETRTLRLKWSLLLPRSEILFICANQMGVLRGCQTG